MKILKRLLLAILLLTLVGLLFRGPVYRHLVTYRSIGPRTTYAATDKKLTAILDAGVDQKTNPDIAQIIKRGLSITASQLTFTAGKNDKDPNQLIHSRKAHCVGYAAFFAATCNYLLKKYNLEDTWTAKPQIGQLYFLGTNVHPYLNSAFFKDHDFVILENKISGETLAVDPTVNDYLYIDFVTYSN